MRVAAQIRRRASEYLAALALNDDKALRLELARMLEAQGDRQGAYEQYVKLLNKLPDAFQGVRRTGKDPLVVAKDLIAASYDSDALDTLRTVADPAALPLCRPGAGGPGPGCRGRDSLPAMAGEKS